MRSVPALLCLSLAGCLPVQPKPDVIFSDDFSEDLSHWVVEQQPEGKVFLENGHLVIADQAGCTVWLKQRLEAPVVIEYTVRASSSARVSDLNCFWMASDPDHPDDLFAADHGRDGKFATYDGLRTYYVGYGGNTNTTTRFRRYDGTGARPLLPEHDLAQPEHLLQPDHTYTIRLEMTADGHARYFRDGELLFDYADPEPLLAGWFGFRTVWSRLEVDSISITRPQ